MKSKGMTLVEIMISVTMISLVMIFTFNILSDMKSENSQATRRSTDSINRATIIRIVQNDFIYKTLIKVEGCPINSSILYCYKFTYSDNSTKMLKGIHETDLDYIVYVL